jgi:hypothetical protein
MFQITATMMAVMHAKIPRTAAVLPDIPRMWIPPLLLTTEDPGAGGVLKILSSPPICNRADCSCKLLPAAVFRLGAEVARVPEDVEQDHDPPVPVLD